MKKKYKENLLGKRALLWALDCAFDMNRGCGCDSLYENDIRFEFDGHKCRLMSVDRVDYCNGTVTLTVLAKGVELKKWEIIRLTFLAKHFRYETLEKIVKEFYMCSNACDNDTFGNDVKAFLTTKMADWFDSYDSITGRRKNSRQN